MPLVKEVLRQGLSNVWVVNRPYEGTHSRAIALWADAMRNYLITITPPSTTVGTASDTFGLELFVATDSMRNSTQYVSLAFENLARSVGFGMPFTFTADPPKDFPIDEIMRKGYRVSTKSDGLDIWVDEIHEWFKTGVAIDNNTGTRTPWV